MRILCFPLLATVLLAGGMTTPTLANPQACADLWTARNEIYKAQGYCFRTERAIRAFGNAGCAYDNVEDVPLSTSQRRQIADIQRVERTHGCPR